MANDSEVWLIWFDLGFSRTLSALEFACPRALEANNAKDSSALGSLQIMYNPTRRHIKICFVGRDSNKASIDIGLGHSDDSGADVAWDKLQRSRVDYCAIATAKK
jgi:hypothetical protein